MKKIGQTISLWILWVIGTIITFGLPLYSVYKNLIKGQENKVIYSMSSALILFIVFLVLSRWVMKIYDRKLQAIATAEEIGVVPATNFIIIRILKQLEMILPIAIIGVILYGMTFIEIPPYLVFTDLVKWIGLGLVFYLAHDWLKVHYKNKNMISEAVAMDEKKDNLIQKRYKTEMKRKNRKHK